MFEGRLHLAAPFRRRLAHVPFGLHHPLWIEDPDFDIRNHVRHTAIPAPGGTKELSNLVSRLVALPLDRTRPLWEIWLIEGLEGGNIGSHVKRRVDLDPGRARVDERIRSRMPAVPRQPRPRTRG